MGEREKVKWFLSSGERRGDLDGGEGALPAAVAEDTVEVQGVEIPHKL